MDSPGGSVEGSQTRNFAFGGAMRSLAMVLGPLERASAKAFGLDAGDPKRDTSRLGTRATHPSLYRGYLSFSHTLSGTATGAQKIFDFPSVL